MPSREALISALADAYAQLAHTHGDPPPREALALDGTTGQDSPQRSLSL